MKSTVDRQRYRKIRTCSTKHYYATFAEARAQLGQYVYACPHCDGFHRTKRVPTADQQRRLIERIFGGPLTPEKVTAYNAMEAVR